MIDEIKRFRGTHFFSGAQLQSFGASRKLVALVRSQPGYRRGERMSIFPVYGRRSEYRLYVEVEGAWSDASLYPLNLKIIEGRKS
jgi:hypothetical protein